MSFDSNKYLCLDVETAGFKDEYGLQPWRAPTDAWLTSIAYQHGDKKKVIASPSKDDIKLILNYAIEHGLTLLCWNSCFDVAWLIAYGFDEEVHTLKHADGMLLHKHLTNSPGHTVSHGLKAVVAEYFPDEAGYEEGVEFFTSDAAKLEQLAAYNQKDVEFTLRLTELIYNKLTPDQRRAAAIEAECIPLIAYANYAGLKVDLDAAQCLKTKLEAKALDLLKELEPHGVTEKIIRSPAQLNTLLFETWGLPKLKGDSTDKEALHELAHIDPRAKQLRELREALNLKTKFVEALINSAEYNEDGTTHPQAIIFGTYSGRLTYSSTQGRGKAQRQTGFAIHQMKRDKEFRNLIKAPDGYTLVEFDAASQEYRLQAILSNDKQMLELCQGKDPHQYMADQIGKGTARQLGKVANLSLAYRTSAPKLKSVARVQYGIPMEIEEAKNIHAAYQQAYPGMVKYWDKQINKGKTKRSVDTLAGRKLHLDGDWNNDAWSLGSSAINYPIQGLGAEQKYLALSVLKPYLREINARFAFDLHDGIYLLIPTPAVDAAIEQIKLLLDNLPYEQAWGFTPAIKLPFDCKAGKSWGAMEEIKFAAAAPDQEGSRHLIAPAPQAPDGDGAETPLDNPKPLHTGPSNLLQVDFRPPNEHALEIALQFAAVGIKTFPCQADKSPAHGFMDWENKASADPATLTQWFTDEYKATARMVGMPCGANNLVAIDPDVPKPEKGKTANGVELFELLVDNLEIDITAAPVIVSPSGGRHYIFAQPYDMTQKRYGCASGALPQNIDVKGDGGYLIASGSVRYDGLAYAPMPGTPQLLDAYAEALIPELPDALASIIGNKRKDDSNTAAERMPKHLLAEALLEHNIPNDREFDSRDKWVDMAHAIYGAASGEEWGRRLWLNWCANRDQKPGEPERVWDTINPKNVRAGAGFIRQQLEDRGRSELYLKTKAAQAQSVFEKVDFDAQQDQQESADPFDGVYFDGDEPPAPVPTIVDELIPAQGLTFLGGQSGAGKTFIAIDLAVSLAQAKPFMGRDTEERLGTIYIAGEGRQTIAPRLEAAKQGRFITDKLPIAVIKDVPDLTNKPDRLKFIAKMKLVAAEVEKRFSCRIGVVIIDTLIACFTFKDENSAGEMGTICKAASEVGDSLGAATLAVHHYGKDASTGLRGSSSLRGAGESVLSVLGNRNEVEGTCTNRRLVHAKSRVGEEGAEFPFELESIFLGNDHKGRPFSAAFVKTIGEGERVKEKQEKAKSAVETDTQVITAMGKNPGASIGDLSLTLKRSKSIISTSLHRLEAKGLVKQNGISSSWVVSKKGFEALKDIEKEGEK